MNSSANEPLKDLISQIKVTHKLKQSQVAERLEVHPSYLSDMINGRVPYTDAFKEKSQEVFHINSEQQPEQFTYHDIVRIPLIPISCQGGSINDFLGNMGNLEFERILSPIKGVTFALTVAGDYLAPELPAGSQVFVKLVNSKAFIEWGKVYALDTCNGVIIRRIMPTLEKDKVMCLSNNPNYPPFEVSLEDVFGFYKVVMAMSIK
jgi:phage repressor protein C with HTH and peptisase S24 domain